MKLPAQNRQGKLAYPKQLDTWVATHKDGTRYWLELKKKVKRRSPAMRGYYFGVVLPTLMESMGYEKDEKMMLHDYLKARYFGIKPDKRGIYRNLPSVFSNRPDVDVKGKKEFIEWIQRKAAEYGIYVPSPNEVE